MMTQIQRSIMTKLKTEFPTYKIYGEKVEQGLIRPCFFVDLLPIDFEEINSEMHKYLVTVDVQYMSLEDTKAKNIEMIPIIPQLFTYISLTDGTKIQTINGQFEIIDGILHYLFDLEFIARLDIAPTEPLIGEINLK